MITDTRCTFGRMSETVDMVTTTLPTSAEDPAEIDITGDIAAEVSVRVSATAHMCLSTTVALAATAMAGGKYDTLDAGRYYFPIVGAMKKLYIRNSAAANVASGLSYHFMEATG